MNGYELMVVFEQQIRAAIVVPNHWVPEEFRDHRTDGVTLEDLETKCDARDAVETDHQTTKREKARRIELYAAMIERGEEIVYED